MNILADHDARISDLESKVNTLVLDAIVVKVHEDDNLVDVEVMDVELENVPYLTQRAGADGKTYWVPEVGESGLLLSPGGNIGTARFMPAVNTKDNASLEKNKNIVIRQWKSQMEEKFDGDNNRHSLTLGPNTKRETEAAGKIKDSVGATALTLETLKATLAHAGVKIEVTPLGVVITAPIVNIVGILQVGGVPLIVP